MSDTEKGFALDARGLRCPWPALRLAKEMRVHDRVCIIVDDPAAPPELRALAEAQGWQLEPLDDEPDVFSVARR